MADEFEADEKEEDVYGDNAREDLAENDEISPQEEAFMEGYEGSEEKDEEVVNEKYETAFEEEEEATEEEDEPEDEF